MRSRTSAIALLVAGLGLGWLVGLSASPVLQVVITGLMTLMISVVAILAGLEIQTTNVAEGEPHIAIKGRRIGHVAMLPPTLMILGLSIGSAFGIYARTNDWLGSDPKRTAARWKDSGLKEADVIRRIFDNVYPPKPPEPSSPSVPKTPAKPEEATAAPKSELIKMGVLFAFEQTACNQFLPKTGAALRAEMKAYGAEPKIQQIAKQVVTTKDLEIFVEEACK